MHDERVVPPLRLKFVRNSTEQDRERDRIDRERHPRRGHRESASRVDYALDPSDEEEDNVDGSEHSRRIFAGEKEAAGAPQEKRKRGRPPKNRPSTAAGPLASLREEKTTKEDAPASKEKEKGREREKERDRDRHKDELEKASPTTTTTGDEEANISSPNISSTSEPETVLDGEKVKKIADTMQLFFASISEMFSERKMDKDKMKLFSNVMDTLNTVKDYAMQAGDDGPSASTAFLSQLCAQDEDDEQKASSTKSEDSRDRGQKRLRSEESRELRRLREDIVSPLPKEARRDEEKRERRDRHPDSSDERKEDGKRDKRVVEAQEVKDERDEVLRRAEQEVRKFKRKDSESSDSTREMVRKEKRRYENDSDTSTKAQEEERRTEKRYADCEDRTPAKREKKEKVMEILSEAKKTLAEYERHRARGTEKCPEDNDEEKPTEANEDPDEELAEKTAETLEEEKTKEEEGEEGLKEVKMEVERVAKTELKKEIKMEVDKVKIEIKDEERDEGELRENHETLSDEATPLDPEERPIEEATTTVDVAREDTPTTPEEEPSTSEESIQRSGEETGEEKLEEEPVEDTRREDSVDSRQMETEWASPGKTVSLSADDVDEEEDGRLLIDTGEDDEDVLFVKQTGPDEGAEGEKKRGDSNIFTPSPSPSKEVEQKTTPTRPTSALSTASSSSTHKTPVLSAALGGVRQTSKSPASTLARPKPLPTLSILPGLNNATVLPSTSTEKPNPSKRIYSHQTHQQMTTFVQQVLTGTVAAPSSRSPGTHQHPTPQFYKLPPGFAHESKAVPALAAAPLLVSPSKQVSPLLVPQFLQKALTQLPTSPPRKTPSAVLPPPPFPSAPPPPNSTAVAEAKETKEPYIYISENGQIFKIQNPRFQAAVLPASQNPRPTGQPGFVSSPAPQLQLPMMIAPSPQQLTQPSTPSTPQRIALAPSPHQVGAPRPTLAPPQLHFSSASQASTSRAADCSLIIDTTQRRSCNEWSVVTLALPTKLHVKCNCFNH